MNSKLFVATKAFVSHNGKVLVIRESGAYADGSNPGKYDIVGGRLEPGENYLESLLREIREETGLEVAVGKPFFVNEFRPTVRGEDWQIIGIFFECSSSSDVVKLSPDHDAYKWIDPADFAQNQVIENLWPAFETYVNAMPVR
jgi:8-oxo-dGTP pyrophosphatase MutT (NUDIX family)